MYDANHNKAIFITQNSPVTETQDFDWEKIQ